MKKRVALVGIYHESNTFSERPTVYSDFENGHLLRGDAIVSHYRDAHHEIGGFIEALDHRSIELVPVFYATATPGGTVTADTYERLKEELGTLLEAVLPVDAVLVAPHGAGVCERYPDMDGDWLAYVRQLVGAGVPVVGTLDPHANVSAQMVASTDALFAYATNPHLDQRQTGIKAALLLNRILLEDLRTCQELIQLPLLISIEQQHTQAEPCKSLYREVQQIAGEQGALHASILLGFPYADVPEMGTAVVVISEQGKNSGVSVPELRSCFLKRHRQFCGQKVDADMIALHAASVAGPVLLLDMGDNVGGGAAGTSMYLMDWLEAKGEQKGCICITHPATVAYIAGFEQGQHFDISFNEINPLNRTQPYTVTLADYRNGLFTEPDPRHGGQVQYDMGKVALLRTENEHLIVVTTLRVPPFSSRQLTSLGIVPETLNWIIAKGVNAPVAAYKDICTAVIQVNTPGETCADPTIFTFKNRRKPLYPFEPITDV